MRELSSHKQIDGYIPQLTGLKVVALFGIFYWHSMPSAGLPDLGARLVELFFVVSGFLVGFRNHGTLDSSISGCWNYLLPKIKAFYPVYLIGLALGVFQHILWGGWNVGAETIFPIVWALGLLQAWIPSIAMVYNGASWFISAWTFCMLCAPVLQWLITKMCNRLGEEKGIVAFSAVTLSVRVFIEECQRLVPGVYPYSLHVTPAIRLLEFALAYAVGVMYRERYSGEKSSFTVMSALEIIVTASLLVFIICFDSIWPRWAYVLMWILVIPLLAEGGGVISWLFSRKPLVSCGKLEMEFFLLHNAIIGIVAILFATFNLGGYKKVALVSLLVTFILSLICYRLFRNHGSYRGWGKSALSQGDKC